MRARARARAHHTAFPSHACSQRAWAAGSKSAGPWGWESPVTLCAPSAAPPPPCAHSSWHPPLRRKGPDQSARTANSREPPPGIVDLPLPPAWARLAGAAVPAGSGSRPAPSTRARAAACTPRLRNAVERHAAAAHASTTSQRSTPASVCAHFAGRGQYAIPNTPPRTRLSSSRGCLRPRAARGRQAHHGVDDAR